MGDVETLRKAAEIMEREGWIVLAHHTRRLTDDLDRSDQDEGLARVLESAYCHATGDEDVWVRTARAAREHLEGKATEADERMARNPDSIAQIRKGMATTEGDVEVDAEPGCLSAEPPVGSVVRDCDGDEWVRGTNGRWSAGCADSGVMLGWNPLNEYYSPLSLVSEPEPEWSPKAGEWAQIKPGVEMIPTGVDRVLVLTGNRERSEWGVAWEGESNANGANRRLGIGTEDLMPVEPRVWERVEDVPRHVVVRDRAVRFWPGAAINPIASGPFTEVLPGVSDE